MGGNGNVVTIVVGAFLSAVRMVLGLFGLSLHLAVELIVAGLVCSFFYSLWTAKTGRRVSFGTIRFVSGPLGSGKSYYASRLIARSLLRQRPVVTNVRLVPQWPKIISGRFLSYRLNSKARLRYEATIRRFYHYEPDINAIVDAQLRCQKCNAEPGACEHRLAEGRGLMVIDEVDNAINNRRWSNEDQQVFLRKLRMARKRGFDVYMLSQHVENTDKGARRIALENIRLVNWQQLVKVPLLGTPLLPFHLFLALTYRNKDALPGAVAREVPTGRSLYLLTWQKDLYDTFQDYAWDDLNAEDDARGVLLPHPVAS